MKQSELISTPYTTKERITYAENTIPEYIADLKRATNQGNRELQHEITMLILGTLKYIAQMEDFCNKYNDDTTKEDE